MDSRSLTLFSEPETRNTPSIVVPDRGSAALAQLYRSLRGGRDLPLSLRKRPVLATTTGTCPYTRASGRGKRIGGKGVGQTRPEKKGPGQPEVSCAGHNGLSQAHGPTHLYCQEQLEKWQRWQRSTNLVEERRKRLPWCLTLSRPPWSWTCPF